jgi:hypothetical protein
MSQQTDVFQLTLKDKVNFPYILANLMLTFQKSILALEFSDREIRECVEGFVATIPSDWMDDRFRKDLDESKIKVKVDIRPRFCGIPATEQVCKELGVPAFKEKISVDYFLRFHACIDLLNRKGLISEKTKTEKVEGVRYGNDGFEQH